MTPLGERIAALIAAQGPMSIAQFMTLTLLDAKDGYYATRDPFGARGDFITAPEVSQMFGELLGLWLAQVWQDQGRPARPRLVELGPGRGTLMNDALRALRLVPAFRDALDVVLVEASPVLRDLQRETLKDCGVAVRWAENFDTALADRPLFLLANEFFDALPIHQYVKSESGWHERMVTLDADGALVFVLAPVAISNARLPANRDGAPRGGVYEQCLAGEALMEEIARAIAAQGGAALIVDYGYDAAGFAETLQAVADHKYAELLAEPGASDLSAHVDFNALGDAVVRGGASVCGPVGQGEFLLALGIVQRADRLVQKQTIGGDWRHRDHLGDSPDIRRQLEKLILPEQMGTLFKALAVVPRTAPMPPGFG
ncbi:MAG TPA: SAM-dependent methyltransferase [Rhizomicrobium sp.]|jgi:SAM-dependent MidA family methyltransferase|nr:SAM-dependent methyltransferase [Rhizomicrobium sp.]